MINYKCYFIDCGVKGNISHDPNNDEYMLFASESDYKEYVEEEEEQ